MKISILVFDLGRNSIVRTYPIAKVLERRYKVQVIGFYWGRIFDPYRDEFQYVARRGGSYPLFAFALRDMLRSIKGDVVYAFKPRPTSFGLGLLAKLRRKVPLVLDIEDWEVGEFLDLPRLSLIKDFFSLWRPNSFVYTYMMERLVGLADKITVSSSFLQSRFGGVKLPHGADENSFNPDRYDRTEIRRKLGIGEDEQIVMFTGTVNPHKGVDEIARAVKLIGGKARLVVVGGGRNKAYIERVIRSGGDRVTFTGYKPHAEMPYYLAAADVVVLPQKSTSFSRAQVPGKIFEAMAMAKPIVSSPVSDLPEILDGCGVITENRKLAEELSYLLSRSDVAAQLGARARERFLRLYSWGAMEKVLGDVFESFTNRGNEG